MSLIDILGPEAIEARDSINAVFEANDMQLLSDDEICLLALQRIVDFEEASWEETK